MTKFSKEIWDIVVYGSVAQRTYITTKEPLYFALYYHPEYFSYALAPYHYEMFDDIKKLARLEVKEVAWIAYRESAKTSLAKIASEFLAISKYRKYINHDAYEKGNAETVLFDIAVALQSNKRLLRDFGSLYNAVKKKSDDGENKQSTMKRINNFILNNGVKMEAFSTQESTRGRLSGPNRPDHYTFDDVETTKTIDSQPITEKIIAHIEEARAGLGVAGTALYLGNFIRDDGVVQHIIENVERSGGIVRVIPVQYPSGVIAWPDKYVKTDKEANEINKNIANPSERKVSLEYKMRQLGDNYHAEMLNQPGKTGEYYFNRDRIESAIGRATKPKRVHSDQYGELFIFEEHNSSFAYGQGNDTSEGIGRDSCTTAIIRKGQGDKPAKLAAAYASKDIDAHTFGYAAVAHATLYGECFIVPEINNTGYATVSTITSPDNCGYSYVYRREVKNKTTGQITQEWGWRSTVSTKSDVFARFKKAWEDGDIEIDDVRILREMFVFRKSDVREVSKKVGTTRHFDLLRAVVLAWEALRFAESKEERDGMYIVSNKKNIFKEDPK